MGRGSKFTLEQRQFLTGLSDSFLQARMKGEKRKVLATCFDSFFERWPVELPADWTPTPYEPPPPPKQSPTSPDSMEVDDVLTAPPSPEELQKRIELDHAKKHAAALADQREEKIKHIENWFGNHANDAVASDGPGFTCAKASRALLGALMGSSALKKHRQMLKATFAYHEMERDRLDPILRERWDAEKRKQNYTNNDKRLAFQNETLKELLALESDEKRAAVDKFRQDDLERRKEEDRHREEAENALLYPDEFDLPEEEKTRLMLVRTRHRAISYTGTALTTTARSVSAKTGLFIMSIAVGPDLTRPGMLTFLFCTSGNTLDTNQTFPEVYSHFGPNVAIPLGRYARRALPDSDWTLAHPGDIRTALTPSAVPPSKGLFIGQVDVDQGSISTDGTIATKAATPYVKQPSPPLPSTQPTVRPLTPPLPSSSSAPPKTNNGGRNSLAGLDDEDSDAEKEDDIIFDEPDRLDITDDDRAAVSPSPERPRPYPKPTSPDSPSIRVESTFVRGDTEYCRIPDGRVMTRYEHDRLRKLGENYVLLKSLGLQNGGASVIATETERQNLHEHVPQSSLPADFEMPPRRTLPARAAKRASSASSAGSDQPGPSSPDQPDLPEEQPDDRSNSPEFYGFPHLYTDRFSLPLPQPKPPGWPDVDVNSRDHVSPTPATTPAVVEPSISSSSPSPPSNRNDSLNVDPPSLPRWMRGAFVYLKDRFKGEDEVSLLSTWLKFELSIDGTSAKDAELSSEGKPGLIAQWERRQRRLIPVSIPDPADFGVRWRAWLTSLMPEWRTVDPEGWPLPRTSVPAEQWDRLRIGGKKGVMLLVISLSWWKDATAVGSEGRDEYQSALEEVVWLMEQLLSVAPSVAQDVFSGRASPRISSQVSSPSSPPRAGSLQSSRASSPSPTPSRTSARKVSDDLEAPSRVTRSKAVANTGPLTRRRAILSPMKDRTGKRMRTRR